MPTTHRHGPETHRSQRAGWLRAAVLGADDGIVSTASLIVGVVGSGASSTTVRTAAVAALAAGALSMAAGEYVSVAAQRDAELADLDRERLELEEHPMSELAELAQIYRGRGLDPDLADQVAHQLTAHNALGAHARDELGLSEEGMARPVQAALTSALAFTTGAVLPLLAVLIWSRSGTTLAVLAVATTALAASGFVGAALGGATRWRAAARVVVGGVAAMLITLAIGHLVGAAVG